MKNTTVSKYALVEQNAQLSVEVNELKLKVKELTTNNLLAKLDAIDPLVIEESQS